MISKLFTSKSSVMAWVGGPKARPVLPVGWFSACGWG
ncbi:hypothetical protein BMG523Draft_04712 [Frankia sp. BMG5.23]|nr:hypothetical protein BMG523Draft_04712 [Frankia sp. BMG5.23]